MSLPLLSGRSRGINISISADTDDWQLSTDPAYNGQNTYIITVESGVVVGATTLAYAMLFDAASGSTVSLVNLGFIVGLGGTGGNGASSGNGSAGTAGGNAIDVQNNDLTITNDAGEINGGGGGGGGGASDNPGGKSDTCATNPGGNGGGGAGTNRPAAKSGTGTSTISTGGTGQTAAVNNGGNGGNEAVAGSVGASDSGPCGTGGSNGAAGKAIDKNGNTVTFISGSGSPNVEGAVS